METIRLTTWIDAPIERCFLLSLSIDLHVASAQSSQERVVGGVTSGIIGEGETVTFEGRHFGRSLRHTSLINISRPYSYFRDVMTAGVFKTFEHDHHFAPMDDGIRIRDEIRFQLPFGTLGTWASKIFVRKHLAAFLNRRNAMIKRVAESNEWKRYLNATFDVATIAAKGETARDDASGREKKSAPLRAIVATRLPPP